MNSNIVIISIYLFIFTMCYSSRISHQYNAPKVVKRASYYRHGYQFQKHTTRTSMRNSYLSSTSNNIRDHVVHNTNRTFINTDLHKHLVKRTLLKRNKRSVLSHNFFSSRTALSTLSTITKLAPGEILLPDNISDHMINKKAIPPIVRELYTKPSVKQARHKRFAWKQHFFRNRTTLPLPSTITRLVSDTGAQYYWADWPSIPTWSKLPVTETSSLKTVNWKIFRSLFPPTNYITTNVPMTALTKKYTSKPTNNELSNEPDWASNLEAGLAKKTYSRLIVDGTKITWSHKLPADWISEVLDTWSRINAERRGVTWSKDNLKLSIIPGIEQIMDKEPITGRYNNKQSYTLRGGVRLVDDENSVNNDDSQAENRKSNTLRGGCRLIDEENQEKKQDNRIHGHVYLINHRHLSPDFDKDSYGPFTFSQNSVSREKINFTIDETTLDVHLTTESKPDNDGPPTFIFRNRETLWKETIIMKTNAVFIGNKAVPMDKYKHENKYFVTEDELEDNDDYSSNDSKAKLNKNICNYGKGVKQVKKETYRGRGESAVITIVENKSGGNEPNEYLNVFQGSDGEIEEDDFMDIDMNKIISHNGDSDDGETDEDDLDHDDSGQNNTGQYDFNHNGSDHDEFDEDTFVQDDSEGNESNARNFRRVVTSGDILREKILKEKRKKADFKINSKRGSGKRSKRMKKLRESDVDHEVFPGKDGSRRWSSTTSECYTCGLDVDKVPVMSDCFEIFDTNNFRKSYKKSQYSTECSSSSGCFKRFLDIGGVYYEKGCRMWPPTEGNSFASKRFAKLEKMLKDVNDGCVFSPSAVLTPFSREISLWVRYHVCVCTGNYCNSQSYIHMAIWIIFLSISFLFICN